MQNALFQNLDNLEIFTTFFYETKLNNGKLMENFLTHINGTKVEI